MKQILHTPEGLRDIYGIEYQKKMILEERLQSVLHLYGYHDIQTPTFEYFDVFGKEMGTVSSKELYKFFDKEGNTLVLRPDITPSIARVVTTLYKTENIPVRVCYKGNTFVNHSNYLGKLRETTQLGAELIDVDSVEADAEMIAMAIESLKAAGLSNFQITIGTVEFLEELIRDAGLDQENEAQLRELIQNRNFFGADDLLENVHAKVTTKAAFQILPELVGGYEVLKEAKKISVNVKVLDAVKRLEMIYGVLTSYGVHNYVTFDLSMCGSHGYYTGIIFSGYTYGTGDAIVKGGRYNNLLEKFGKKSPSVGFVIVVDELLNAFSRQKIEIECERKNTFILYDDERRSEAIRLVKDFRNKNKKTELTKKQPDTSIEVYAKYAQQNMCISMLYLKTSGEIEMINLISGKRKVVTTNIM